MSDFMDTILATLPEGWVQDVRIGFFWTAVVVETENQRRCGLASTLHNDLPHGETTVHDAGDLIDRPATALTALLRSANWIERSVGMATVNALLKPQPERWVEANAETVLAERGAGKHVVLVGHFPFIPRLRECVGKLTVLEKVPSGDDLPADAAGQVVPQADILAITGTTLINGTFDSLLALRRPQTPVLVLGPSTPLSPVLFDYGVDFLSGSVVEAIEPVLRAVIQGGNFRQIHRRGVRLVTIRNS